MNVWMIFKVSILAILRNKTRSLLTCIGIIVGIAAVIAVLAIGKGASTMMVREISSMGNNLVMVWPDWNRRGTVRAGMGAGQTMTAGDAEAIVRELGHLVGAVTIQHGDEKIQFHQATSHSSMISSSPKDTTGSSAVRRVLYT